MRDWLEARFVLLTGEAFTGYVSGLFGVRPYCSMDVDREHTEGFWRGVWHDRYQLACAGVADDGVLEYLEVWS